MARDWSESTRDDRQSSGSGASISQNEGPDGDIDLIWGYLVYHTEKPTVKIGIWGGREEGCNGVRSEVRELVAMCCIV